MQYILEGERVLLLCSLVGVGEIKGEIEGGGGRTELFILP